MIATVLSVPRMDCASEEHLIDRALDGIPVVRGVTCDQQDQVRTTRQLFGRRGRLHA